MLAAPAPPLAPPQANSRSYHGSVVSDPFLWLEEQSNPEANKWGEAQSEHARHSLNATPVQSLVEAELRKWLDRPLREYRQLRWAQGNAYCLVSDSHQTPAQLAQLPGSLLGSNTLSQARSLIDPLKLDPSGRTEIDWYVPSPDGSKVAVLLVQHGRALQGLHFFDTASGAELSDILPGVQTDKRKGSAAWSRDGQGIYYTRYPAPVDPLGSEGSGQVLWHELGTDPQRDRLELSRGIPAEAALELKTDGAGRFVLASSHQRMAGEHAHWLRSASGRWKLLAGAAEKIEQAEFGRAPTYVELPEDDALYLLSRAKAPKGRLVRMPLGNPALEAENLEVVVPESKETLVDFRPAGGGIYTLYLKGGMNLLVFHDALEKDPKKSALILPTPGIGSVRDFLVSHGDRLLYQTESFVDAPEWISYDPNIDRERTHPTPLFDVPGVDFADCEVDRVSVKSGDGTRVPLYLIQRRGARQTGSTPTLLCAPEGGAHLTRPTFAAWRKLWLNQGGMFAIAQIRGGTELGPDSRQDGMLQRKRNAYEDLAACARYLVASNYTRPALLGLMGERFGALSSAAVMVEQPQLVQAVALTDGVYDALRAGQMAGAVEARFELGSPTNKEWVSTLLNSSPYHQVKNQRPYPAAWIRSAPQDRLFSAGHSWKLAAALQQNTTASRPVLLSTGEARPAGTKERFQWQIGEWADRYSFFFEQLAAPYSLVDRGPWSGGITPTSAVVKAKLLHNGLSARLILSKNPIFTPSVAQGPATSDALGHNLVEFQLASLDPGTDYHYGLEINGRFDWASRGQFRTFPGGPSSFRIAFASCAKTASVNEVFDRIRESRPLFYMNMGDFHYLNISSNNRALFREAYDIVLSSPPQARLYRAVPLVYMWDDHDYGGNNSNRKASSHPAARQAYEEYVPHYPLVAGDSTLPIYQAFSVGRVRFIITDLRSQKDDVKKPDTAAKSMMGPTQKAWFKQQLLDANGKYPLICWMSSVPWLGVKGTNYYPFIKADDYGYFHHSQFDSASRTNKAKPSVEEDHWCVFSTERREIADFIKENKIRGVCILHGDSHMLAADDGRNADYATGGGVPIPVMCAGPLDQTSSIKGGPYSQGVYRVKKDEGCYGLLDVTDRGDSIDVIFSGRNHKDQEKISLRFSVPAQP
jgi:prolyl oligopeptidase